MERVFRLIRGRKVELVAPLSPKSDKVWRVVKDGPDLKEGDLVCSKRPMPVREAAKRVASWRTKVAPTELCLLKPVEGWKESQGDLVQPYADLLRFEVPDQDSGPPPAA